MSPKLTVDAIVHAVIIWDLMRVLSGLTDFFWYHGMAYLFMAYMLYPLDKLIKIFLGVKVKP